MIQIEEEPPASFEVPYPPEVLVAVSLIRAKLPTELLAEIAAEMNGPIEVEHQVAGLLRQHARTELAERRHLSMLDQPVDQPAGRAFWYPGLDHGVNLRPSGARRL
jgi:hypothetical protein